MTAENPYFTTRIASSESDLQAAQRLRYRVFVEELGGDGVMVDHANRLERDSFDDISDHLLLIDKQRPPDDQIVGVYRLLPQDRAEKAGHFYTEGEYDLTPLRQSGRKLLELGRSCLAPEYRGGPGVFLLWNGLAEYILTTGAEILFGVASFHGTDAAAMAQPLSWLHHHHLAPPAMRPRARNGGYQRMDLLPADQLDRREAMRAMPPLIKAYLRLGCTIGDGAFLDRDFNTTDVLIMIDTANMSARHRSYYEERRQQA